MFFWSVSNVSRLPGPRFVFVTCILFAFASFSGLFINRAVAPARVAIAVIPVLIMLNLEILSGSWCVLRREFEGCWGLLG